MKAYKRLKRGYRLLTDRRYKQGDLLAGKYLVKSALGMGSYGMTYLCINLERQQLCVIKQMTKSKKQKVIREQYNHETQILEHLNHPNIPTFFEQFIFEKNYFFSMEYIKGRNLEDVLFADKFSFTERGSLVLVRDLLNIVAYVHSMGIIHGDIRIPNVILQNDKPYIIDFGLAELFENPTETSKRDQKEKIDLLREDYFDIGDLLLFLLYSNYGTNVKKGRSWTEELTLHPQTTYFLKRLLNIREPYTHTLAAINDVNRAIVCLKD
ncbi:serine/threonine protein kinase [Aquibacillus rhizosphaerae]|uniref:non-specific serine/threonine protein kinase n=1 Tax=Aquibacillus rhizosphaerae TaxID=3051431 RepID=A0ABT7LBD6_9BACI|nr:protein kinase [Aquibacillus sp. LR5S19]MDL4843181.1 protein kinase [Aquibacillus sp. LR5S19]